MNSIHTSLPLPNAVAMDLEEEEENMEVPVQPPNDNTTTLIGFNPTLTSHLLLETPSDFFSTPIIPLKTQVGVPFQWEEVPGKPKPCSDITPYQFPPSLQPPPGLLQRPDTGLPFLDTSRSSKGHWSFISPRDQDHDAPKVAKTKGFWRKMAGRKKEEDLWSPTSTLFGPEPGKRGLYSSFSSLSSSSVPDLSSTYSPGSSEVQSGQNTLTEEDDSDVDYSLSSTPNIASRHSHRRDENQRRSQLKKRASESMRSIVKLWRKGVKWRHAKTQQKRRFTETEMWAPTLATYFHSMGIEQESDENKQLVLLDKGSQEAPSEDSSELPSPEIDVSVQP